MLPINKIHINKIHLYKKSSNMCATLLNSPVQPIGFAVLKRLLVSFGKTRGSPIVPQVSGYLKAQLSQVGQANPMLKD